MHRGDVYRLRIPQGLGHEQQGPRFGVVVQAEALLPRSVVIVAPTSQDARPASFRPEIELAGATTRVLAEQLGAVDVGRLGDLVGHLTPEEAWDMDEALRPCSTYTDVGAAIHSRPAVIVHPLPNGRPSPPDDVSGRPCAEVGWFAPDGQFGQAAACRTGPRALELVHPLVARRPDGCVVAARCIQQGGERETIRVETPLFVDEFSRIVIAESARDNINPVSQFVREWRASAEVHPIHSWHADSAGLSTPAVDR